MVFGFWSVIYKRSLFSLRKYLQQSINEQLYITKLDYYYQ